MIQITEAQRNELERWVHSRSLPPADVFRARLILALASGQSYSRIMRILQTTAPTIARWKKRFEQFGIDGLDARHRGGQGKSIREAIETKLVSAYESASGDEISCRKLAARFAVGKSTVQRISAQYRLRPHRLDRFMAGTDGPQIGPADRVGIVGLYLHSRQHAAAFSLDDCSDTSPPTRHQGVDALLTALNSGFSALSLKPGHSSRPFTDFREAVLRHVGHSSSIHLILDNASAHKTLDVELFLAAHPHFYFHFLPNYAAWLEHVNLWVSKIRADTLRAAELTEESNLSGSIERKFSRYMRTYAKSALPFCWISNE